MNRCSDRPPSVLHIIGNSKFGGATQIVLALAEEAKDRGWSAAVLTDDPVTVRAFARAEIEVLEFRGIVRPVRPWADYAAARRLACVLRQRTDTIVHTHTLKGGIVGRWAAHRAGVPAIIHHNHGLSFGNHSSLARRSLITVAERFAARWCDRIISVNESDVEYMIDAKIAPPDKLRLVPNGIEASRIADAVALDRAVLADILNAEQQARFVVFVGRLVAEKGVPWLLKAHAALLADVNNPPHLLFLGDGPDRDRFEKDVQSRGLSRVHFLGHREDCLSIAKACDVFVLPSLREGHSITILEAMALGKPIVATSIRGIRDSVRHESEALLVPPRDETALATALRRMLADQTLSGRLGEAARLRFLDEYTLERMVTRVRDVYEELLRGKEIQ